MKFRDKITGVVYQPASEWVAGNYAKSERFEELKEKKAETLKAPKKKGK